MNFLLLPASLVAAGAAALGLLLWLLQRLRVQHREVEVVSTLFWQAAVKERQARVFVQRFRHWPAWLLLFAIVSLLWMLLAHPSAKSSDGREHVILVDSSQPESLADEQIQAATKLADSLPRAARSVLLTGASITTLVAKGEAAELAGLRRQTADSGQPENLHWSLEQIAARSNTDNPLTIHLLGLTNLNAQLLNDLPDSVSVVGVPLSVQDAEDDPRQLPNILAFGYSDALSGDWKQVDVSLELQTNEPIDIDQLSIRSEKGETFPLELTRENSFFCSSVPANGSTLSLAYGDNELARLFLPERNSIRVQIGKDTPRSVIDFLSESPEFTIVQSNAEVRVGSSSEADLQLSNRASPAFEITTDSESLLASQLISDLAIDQIDATSLATQAQQPITLDIVESDKRKVSIWKPILGGQFNFQESRSFPIFVGQTIRWLADRPAEITSLAQGDKYPSFMQTPSRVVSSSLQLSDGKQISANRLSRPLSQTKTLDNPGPSTWLRLGPFTWMGILAVSLLTLEWILYQRGKLP